MPVAFSSVPEISTLLRTLVSTARSPREESRFLRPGTWRRQGRLWHHTEINLPGSLCVPSSEATSLLFANTCATAESGWSKAGRRAYSALLRLAERDRVRIPRVGMDQGDATILVRAQGDKARFVALSPGTEAIRLGLPGSFSSDYVDVRNRIQRHLRGPSFRVEEDGAILIEDWCNGPTLGQLPPAKRVEHVNDILRRMAEMVPSEAVGDGDSTWRGLQVVIDKAAIPRWLADPLADPSVRHLLELRSLIPSQGDLWAGNIIVDAVSEAPLVIDFDGAGWLPPWYDLAKLMSATLVTNMGRLATGTDHKLREFWSAIGIDDGIRLDAQNWAALYGVGWAYRQCFVLGVDANGDGIDYRRFVKVAEKRAQEWTRLAP